VQEVANLDTGDAIAHVVEFDKSGKSVAVGCSDGEIKFVNVERNEVTSQIKAHEGSVSDLVFNQDNSTIYSVGGDGIVKVWR